MTANQIAYQANLEAARSNRAREQETNRSNVAREQETHRHNKHDEAISKANAITGGIANVGKGLQGFGSLFKR